MSIKRVQSVKTLVRSTLIILTLCMIAACTPQEAAVPTPSPTATPKTELTGVVVLADIDSDDPISKIREFQPIADYLAQNLSEYGIGRGEVKIVPDVDSMIKLVETGQVVLYYDSLYPAMLVMDSTGSRPLIRGWRRGEPTYRSVFFTLESSGITSIEDLKGKVLAYDDISSTSGYMMPNAYLISHGLNPVEKASTESVVADDEVGYVFSGDDENVIEWVLSGRADAGVVDNIIYMSDIEESTRESLVIVAETEDVPRRVVIVGPNVTPEMADVLSEILIQLDQSEEGLALLKIVKTLKFDEFPEGVEAAFKPIKEMFEIVTDHR